MEQISVEPRISISGRVALPPPLRAHPHRERDHHRNRQRKPGDGVLQVIVLEMNPQRTGLRNAAFGQRLLQIDVKRRDRLAVIAPAE